MARANLLGLLLAAATTAVPLAAQCEVAKLPDGGIADYAQTLTVWGDTLMIGAAGESSGGSVHTYRRQGANWIRQLDLHPVDGPGWAQFGRCVASREGIVVVAGESPGPGSLTTEAVYIFRIDAGAWVQQQKLLPPTQYRYFGRYLAVSDDVVAVFAREDRASRMDTVLVFRSNGSGWFADGVLTPEQWNWPGDTFGQTIGVWDDVIILGAREVHENGDETEYVGAAYVYRHDGASWQEEQKLLSPERWGGSDLFGASVAIRGDVALIGAPLAGDGGGAYVFRFDGAAWAFEQLLAPPNAESDDGAGASVALDGDTAIVGAPPRDGEHRPGYAYTFRFDGQTWVPQNRLSARVGRPDEGLGQTVALSGDAAVLGMRSREGIYVFALDTTCDLGDLNCDGGFDAGDIEPFFLAIGNPDTYRAAYPGCPLYGGDTNCDGSLDAEDVDAFFACLGGACGRDCDANGSPDRCEAVAPLEILSHPRDTAACVADSVTLSVEANRALHYKWRKNGVPMHGRTSSSLTIDSVQFGHAGVYDVMVSDNCETIISEPATLTVGVRPVIYAQPASQTLCEGQPAVFTVGAIGDDLTYQWRKDGADISGAVQTVYLIGSAGLSDGGVYSVVVSSPCEMMLSEPATLSVFHCEGIDRSEP